MGIESLIPLGASLLGAFGGSKGQQSHQQTQQVMDPRMVPYIFGANGQGGLLNGVQSQLAQSQSPQNMQGWQNIMQRGQGLLGGSVAGNPFSGGGYQGGSLRTANLGAMGNGLAHFTAPPLPAPAPPAPNPAPTLEQLIAQIQNSRGGYSGQDDPLHGGY